MMGKCPICEMVLVAGNSDMFLASLVEHAVTRHGGRLNLKGDLVSAKARAHAEEILGRALGGC